MGAAGFAASSSFFEQAASVKVALHAMTSKERFADAENMASPFLYAPGLLMPVALAAILGRNSAGLSPFPE
jgi:hypothetical protein